MKRTDPIAGKLTTLQLATKHGEHRTIINDWNRMAIAGLASIFDGKGVEKEVTRDGKAEKLHAAVG